MRAVSPTGNWIACDNFRLYYIGGDKGAFDAEFNRLIAEGEALMGAKAHEVATGTLGAALIAARLVALGGNNSQFFDLQGRAVTHPDQVTPGLYIVNGRKVLIK